MASTTVEINLNGKKYMGKLSAQAIENVEAQFGDQGILHLAQRLSLRISKAIIVASVVSETPGVKSKDVAEDCDAEMENGGGLTALVEAVNALLQASGMIKAKSGKS